MIKCDHSRDYKSPVHCNTCVPPMFKPKRKIADVDYHHCDLYKQWIPCYFYPCCICNTSIVMSGNNVQIWPLVFACPFLEVNDFFKSYLFFFWRHFEVPALCCLKMQQIIRLNDRQLPISAITAAFANVSLKFLQWKVDICASLPSTKNIFSWA